MRVSGGKRRLAPAAFVTSAVLALGVVGLTAAPAQAAPGDTSNAAAQVLGGSLLSAIDTDSVVGLGGSTAGYPSEPGPNSAGLDPSLLSAVDVNLGSVTLPLGDLIQLGAVTQFSQAEAGGTSNANSGVAESAGGLTVGNAQTTTPTAALIDLGPLLADAGLSSAIDQASVSVGAVSADASITDATTLDRSYNVASLDAQLHSQLVAGLTGDVDDLITNTVTPTINGLTGTITDTVNTALGTVGLLTAVAGADFDTNVSLTGVGDIGAAADTVLNQTLTSNDGAVTLNPATGTIDVDLAALAGGLNNRAPETPVLSADTLNALVQDVNDLLDQLGTNLVTAINQAIDGIGVHISSTLDSGNPLTGAFALSIDTTLGDLTAGNALPVNTGGSTGAFGLISGLAGLIVTALSGPLDTLVGGVVNGLIGTVTDTITGSDGLIQGVTTALDPVLRALGNVVGITLNHQTGGDTSGVSTETALQVTLLNSTAAQLNLATAQVGPNVVAPVITTLDPDHGPTTGGTSVTISGTGLAGATGVTVDGQTVDFVDNGDGTLTIPSMPAHDAGAADVVVTNPAGTSQPASYTYYEVPANLAIDPDAGPSAGGQTVTISGDNLDTATAVDFAGTSYSPAGSGGTGPFFTYDSEADTITLDTPAHAAGAVQVVVTNPGGDSAPLAYTYYDVPANLAIDPAAGPIDGGQTVTISGDGLAGATVVDFGGVDYYAADDPDAPAGAPTFTQDADTGDITLVTPASPTGAAGDVDVTVTNPAGTSDPVTYSYVAAPSNVSISPEAGPIAGGQTVTISGDDLGGATSVDFGGTTYYAEGDPDAPAGSPTFTQDAGTGDITLVTPASSTGDAQTVDVTVTTAGGTSAPVDYDYVAGPAITSVGPDSGPLAGGQTVTISGDDLGGATSVDFGDTTYYAEGDPDAPAGSPTFTQDPDTGDITLVTPAATDPGSVPVTVTAPGGTTPPFDYTYVAAPAISGMTPDEGPVTGGTTVTLTGTGFTDATSVTVDNVAATSFTVVSDTEITFVTPPHAAGDTQVIVTTAGGPSNPEAFTYVPVPTASALSPDSGPVAGGTEVTITGTGFVPGETSVTIGGTTVPASDVTVSSDGTSLTFTTPAGAAGAADVTVTTPGGTADAPQFTYVPVPTASALSPDSGPVAGGTEVTITGTGFVPGETSVTIGGTTVPASDVTVSSDGTSLTFTTPAGAAGAADVTVTTPGGTADAPQFTYVPVPTADTLSPSQGPATGGTSVTITGSGFVPGETTVTIGGTTVPASDVTVSSDGTSLTFTTPAGTAGAADVTVTTPGGTTGALPFTYIAVPAVTGMTPDSGPVAGGTTVTLTGSGFTGASTVTVDGVDVSTFTVDSDTQITLVTPPHAAGEAPVVVTTAGGDSEPQTFTYVPVPTATSLSPSMGPTTGGTTVTISGSGFVAGETTVTIGGVTIPAASVTVNSDGSLTFVTPAHAEGDVDVTVTTPGGTSGAQTFSYVAGPVITGLSPDSGPTTGGDEVTISGADLDGATEVTVDGQDVPFTQNPDGSITITTPPHAAGDADIVVTTAAGSSPAASYTYVSPPPTVSGIDPDQGPTTGGTQVTISGDDLGDATSVTVDGDDVPFTQNPDGSITVTMPPHDAGTAQIVVTTPSGSSDPVVFTYVSRDACVATPTSVSISPNHGPDTGGTTTVLTGTGYTGATAVSFGETPAASFTVASDTEIIAVTPPHLVGTVEVYVTTPCGVADPTYTYEATAAAAATAANGSGLGSGSALATTGQNLWLGGIVLGIGAILAGLGVMLGRRRREA
ncbi:hypothetical protein GCM10022288_12170 [Gryllotalpicola kribbensis]|uniref:IPT/TIG domain-containing protein n=1 Tax=Gryllotalpicola kribbensis TaxID=993084 RepID=A0ABP8APE3_9MICO